MRPEVIPTTRAHRLSLLLALCLVATATALPAQDTPEMLAAMRSHLPPVPDEVPTRDELPADVRVQLPPLAIETHRWHDDAAQRFVILHGRRVEENGVVDRDLWLRRVRPDGVVLQFRDHFFFVPR